LFVCLWRLIGVHKLEEYFIVQQKLVKKPYRHTFIFLYS
jgi:hypothetical protein